MSVARSTDIGVQILAAATGVGNLGGQLMQNAAMVAIALPNSRESESEADQIGLEIAARAGFDPASAVTLWEKMGKLSEGKGPGEFLSTHPSPENRAKRLKELGAKMQPLYEAAKANPALHSQRYVNLNLNPNERVIIPGANERVVKPAPPQAK
jgi:predicted Zn-dependent protease